MGREPSLDQRVSSELGWSRWFRFADLPITRSPDHALTRFPSSPVPHPSRPWYALACTGWLDQSPPTPKQKVNSRHGTLKNWGDLTPPRRAWSSGESAQPQAPSGSSKIMGVSCYASNGATSRNPTAKLLLALVWVVECASGHVPPRGLSIWFREVLIGRETCRSASGWLSSVLGLLS